MLHRAYLDAASRLLEHYAGTEPFHLYIKRFYAAHKQYGARDRKQITQLCYSWFRAGHGLTHVAREQQLIYALFLCSDVPNPVLRHWDEHLYNNATKTLEEKLRIVGQRVAFEWNQLFPWHADLSPEIDPLLFQQSLLLQPKVYLRLRPGKELKARAALQANHIPFEGITEQCIALHNSAKADAVLHLDRDAVVQDLNSQQVLNLLKEHGDLKKACPELEGFTVWDCCAASGGKSLLLLDTLQAQGKLFSSPHITVSDVRENILHNLRNRFQKAGIKKYTWFVGNAATDAPPGSQLFDVILCDVPCSGSGTWSRTAEQLHTFKTEKIEAYAQLQKSIVANVSRYLKPGGWLLYSTCSVFKRENEDVVHALTQNSALKFLKSAYYKGYDKRADTLFAALFQAS